MMSYVRWLKGLVNEDSIVYLFYVGKDTFSQKTTRLIFRWLQSSVKKSCRIHYLDSYKRIVNSIPEYFEFMVIVEIVCAA